MKTKLEKQKQKIEEEEKQIHLSECITVHISENTTFIQRRYINIRKVDIERMLTGRV